MFTLFLIAFLNSQCCTVDEVSRAGKNSLGVLHYRGIYQSISSNEHQYFQQNFASCNMALKCIMVTNRKRVVHTLLFLFQVIFGNLFKLPVSPQLELFYGSLLVDLCKSHQATIPGVVSFTCVLYIVIKKCHVVISVYWMLCQFSHQPCLCIYSFNEMLRHQASVLFTVLLYVLGNLALTRNLQLAQATELLYERINTMNTTCLHR